MLTCYDASFAALLETAGVDVLLVGDSLGMVVQGQETTLPVSWTTWSTTPAASRAARSKPSSSPTCPSAATSKARRGPSRNAAKLMAAGAQMVKLEGGAVMAKTVAFLTERGIPVCGHVGLTPQSVHQLGGYKVQGKGDAAAQKLIEDARALEAGRRRPAGAGSDSGGAGAAGHRSSSTIPTIGIGAGPDCSGQVLVLYDMLGIYPGKPPKFAKNFLTGADGIQAAVERYVKAVKSGAFPAPSTVSDLPFMQLFQPPRNCATG